MFCHNCGTKAIEGAEYCQKCGAKLIKDEGSSKAPPTESFSKPVVAKTPPVEPMSSPVEVPPPSIDPAASTIATPPQPELEQEPFSQENFSQDGFSSHESEKSSLQSDIDQLVMNRGRCPKIKDVMGATVTDGDSLGVRALIAISKSAGDGVSLLSWASYGAQMQVGRS